MSAAAAEVGRRGQVLLDLVVDIGRLGGFGVGIKKDCIDLSRRISRLSHLFEEVRDYKGAVPMVVVGGGGGSASSSEPYCCALDDLLVALKSAKRLLLVALNSTDSNVDDANKKTTYGFQCVTLHLERALEKFPYEYFDISDEVQEQVGLVKSQLRRASERYAFVSPRVLPRAQSQPLDRELDLLSSGGVIQTWIDNVDNLRHDSQMELDITIKASGMIGSCIDQAVYGLEGLRTFSCSPVSPKPVKVDVPKAKKFASSMSSEENVKAESVPIPDDFRCPISLELMRDPVIVSTGQTYERSFIQRWVDCGNKTCPKTQQVLSNLTLTPNYVLRSLISQWCQTHKIEQPLGLGSGRIRKSDGSYHEVTGDVVAIETLVRKLSSQSAEERRTAVTEIRSLSKRSTDNRILIAQAGAIPVLINLLTSEDVRTQENAVTAILNLSIFENNKGLIILAGAVPSIVQILRMGSMEARENAAATLFSLSLSDENKITIGASGAIPALVELLKNGSLRGKKDAATALFNLCIYQGNKGRAVRAGILLPLMKMLTDSSSSMVDEALTILSVLASHHEGKAAIAKATIPVLVDLLRTGLPRNKENSAAILLALCKKDAENLACIGRLGAVVPLTELARSGTERAKRKAASLLEHLRKMHQL
ncbi:hypothetical protein Scep_016315 [Stephania cephalantha]|uniref:RING-type E3 ubiquitin transferase n=1 Tax=Stephania cephalantha TaxID=152367 RepID=A0AAP0NSH8_9MAGN